MDSRLLVRGLEDPWQGVLDHVLRGLRSKAPTTRDVARLGARVAELSRAYNAGMFADVPLDARIGFSFPRDVPKGAAAVRELIATRALTLGPARPLRIVDLGAGLGAMTWGIVRALEGAGATGSVEAVFVDENRAALDAAEEIVRRSSEARLIGNVKLSARTLEKSLSTDASAARSGLATVGKSDIVILGQALSELDTHLTPPARIAKHAAFLLDLLDSLVADDGSLVIVEPALRDRTRHLHAVRNAVADKATIFAPCLHASGCPALEVETNWCHEDLDVDLPSWLIPIARAAGLRWQGLTFSYLILRRDGTTLHRTTYPAASDSRRRVHFRVVSGLLETKGKREVDGCTAEGKCVRIRCLDRDAADLPEFAELRRGQVVTLTPTAAEAPAEPAINERGRLSRNVAIDVWPPKK